MVEGQGPVTPGNRRKRNGANSPACFAEDEIILEDPCFAEVIFLFKAEKAIFVDGNDELACKVYRSQIQKMICVANQ